MCVKVYPLSLSLSLVPTLTLTRIKAQMIKDIRQLCMHPSHACPMGCRNPNPNQGPPLALHNHDPSCIYITLTLARIKAQIMLAGDAAQGKVQHTTDPNPSPGQDGLP